MLVEVGVDAVVLLLRVHKARFGELGGGGPLGGEHAEAEQKRRSDGNEAVIFKEDGDGHDGRHARTGQDTEDDPKDFHDNNCITTTQKTQHVVPQKIRQKKTKFSEKNANFGAQNS